MPIGRFARVDFSNPNRIRKVESLESVNFTGNIYNGTIANNLVYAAKNPSLTSRLCYVNDIPYSNMNLSDSVDQIYIDGVANVRSAVAIRAYYLFNEVIVTSLVTYKYTDITLTLGDYPTSVRPIVVDGFPSFLDTHTCHLHMLANGDYVLLDKVIPEGTTAYIVTSNDDATETTVSIYVGPYGQFHMVNFEVLEGEYSLSINPEELIFEKNTGTHEIYYIGSETYSIKFEFEGVEQPVSLSGLKSIIPEESGVNIGSGLTPISFIVDTDTNTADTFTINFSVNLGLGTVSTLIKIISPTNSDPYNPGGISGPGGGNGKYPQDQNDNVSLDLPVGSDIGDDSSTGMYTRYLMNKGFLELLGDWVYDPNAGLSLIKEALGFMYGDTGADALISLLSFPFTLNAPLVGVTYRSQPMYFGHQPVSFLGVIRTEYLALTSGSAQIDWGTVNLQEYWGNFLDYSPHTKLELYLPWGTGFVSLDPGQCLPGTLTVKTNIEFARGSCVHNVINDKGCIIGTYSGQPGSMVPLISSDISAKRAGMVLGAVGVAAGAVLAPAVASGFASSAAQDAASAAYNATINTARTHKPQFGVSNYFEGKSMGIRDTALSNAAAAYSSVKDDTYSELMKTPVSLTKLASNMSVAAARQPVHVQRNGGFGDASAGMMVQYPYLIISRPEQNVPENYGHHYGYPSNIYEPLRFLQGYTEIAAIHLNGIGCTASEQSELEGILSGGVIF